MARIKIGPKKAAELLENNDHNRKITQSRVSEYAKEMRNGMWMYNGETITRSVSGKLMDGQHRLLAVIASGVEIDVEFIDSIPDKTGDVDIFLTINTKNRSNVDALTIAGFKDRPQHIAKLMAFKEAFNSKKLAQKPSGIKLMNHEVVELAREFTEEEAIRIIDRAESLCSRADVLTLPFWLLGTYALSDVKDGSSYLETLAEGDIIRDGCPISAFIARLEALKTEGGSSGVSKRKFIGMFKAYDYHINKMEMKMMSLKAGSELKYPSDFSKYQD